MKIKKDNLVKIGGLVLIVFLSYSPALKAGFVWDDVVITTNTVLKAPDGLWTIWSKPSSIYHESHYWPMVYSSFWLEYQFWGIKSWIYHLDNILLHAVNVIILFV